MMMKIFFAIFIFMFATEAIAQKDCSINLTRDIKNFSPVILTAARGDYQLFKPTGETTTIKEGAELLLACTGNKYIAGTFSDTARLRCTKGKFMSLNNVVHSVKEILCHNIPVSSLKPTTEKCSNGNGFIYKSGFMIRGRFYGPVLDICYNKDKSHTYFTKHIINGAAIKYSISDNSRRTFIADGMQFSTAVANGFYKRENQLTRFKNLFGPTQTYLNDKKFLARGHMTPDADFVFVYEKLATYYYSNVAPEFQAVNAGNWLRVEELARAVATSYRDDIISYTTYMDDLTLPAAKGNPLKIYLDDAKKIEVPKYLIKVLQHRASDSAIVFITVNNPFLRNGQQEEFCTNVCRKAGLLHANFSDVTKGYTFCCELKDFKLFVNALTNDVKGKKLLTLK